MAFMSMYHTLLLSCWKASLLALSHSATLSQSCIQHSSFYFNKQWAYFFYKMSSCMNISNRWHNKKMQYFTYSNWPIFTMEQFLTYKLLTFNIDHPFFTSRSICQWNISSICLHMWWCCKNNYFGVIEA